MVTKLHNPLWSISAKIFPATTNRNCTSNHQHDFSNLDVTGINFSIGVRVEDIPKTKSKKNLNINFLNSMLM